MRRNYRAFAELLKGQDEQLIKDFCDFFKADNPDFDEKRFRDAIKVFEGRETMRIENFIEPQAQPQPVKIELPEEKILRQLNRM